MNETIQIHLFEAIQDIFEKIFKEKAEIINKKYGYIYTRYLEEYLSKNTIQRFIKILIIFFNIEYRSQSVTRQPVIKRIWIF